MKTGTLRFIPLQAELCLNKQKVDIEDFKGWQKCNAPVYGGCLSPLYKKDNDHHDFFIGDDYYDFTNGVLSKNGNEVLSGAGTKKLKKAKTNLDVNSLAVSSDNKLTWVKETGGNSIKYSLHEGEEQTTTISNAQRIIQTKAFESHANALYGIVVWYLHTSGGYGYYIAWSDGGTDYTSYGEGDPTVWSTFDVKSPLIQVGVMAEHKFMVSFFGSSGADIPQTNVKNVFVDTGSVYENPTFTDPTNYPTRYNVVNEDFGINVDVKSYFSIGGKLSPVSLVGISTSMYKVHYYNQKINITITKALSYPITVGLFYTDANGVNHVQRTITIPAGTTTFTDNTVAAVCFEDNLVGNDHTTEYFSRNGTTYTRSTLPSDFFLFPCYIMSNGRSSFGYTVSYTSDAAPNDPTLPQNLTTQTFYSNQNAVKGTTNYSCKGLSMNTYGTTEVKHIIRMDWSPTWNINDLLPYLLQQGITSQAKNCGDVFNGTFPPSTCLFDDFTWNIAPFSCNGVTLNTQIVNNSAVAVQVNSDMAQQNRYTKSAFIDPSAILKGVDCCLDDGKFYCVGAIYNNTEDPLPQKLVVLSGTFTAFDTATKNVTYVASATLNIMYDANASDNVFPKYYGGMDISLSNNMLRIMYKFKAKSTDTKSIFIMIDSLAIAEGETPAHLYPGVLKDTSTNIQGGVLNTANQQGWRFLFNNNMLSNISCYEEKGYIGTILCDWNTINIDFCPAYNTNVLYYKDNSNTIWKIEMLTIGQDWDYKLVEDRYVVLNTTNYFNCYDTKTGLKRHWASDYNNRIIFGVPFTSYTNNSTFKGYLESALFEGFIITGQNANYEMTKDTITGLELGAIYYEQCLKDYMAFISCGTPYGAVEGIDYYRGDEGSTSAAYVNSFSNGMKYVDNDLSNPAAIYPISQNGDVRYNPNLFTQFIRSYNNKDMVISDGIAYRLMYYNNVIPVMAYFLLDGVEELLNAFVLQTSYYGVSETRLYQMNYNNGVGVEVVADITGLEYLGALPSQALFWSAQNRAIYSFRGNCIMTLMQYANELTGIYGKWYNPATQELFLDTNVGILVFSDLGTYCLEWETETTQKTVKDIFFFADRFLVNLVDDTEYTHYYSYNPLEEYESNLIKIITKYYGNGLVPITVNNIYIRLYNQGEPSAVGSIVFKGHTITDIGVHTDTKEIAIGGTDDPEADPPEVAGEQWDPETDTMLVKYTPQYNRGLGFALELVTTFPIIDIKFDYVENGSIESQIAHINI